MKIYAAAVCLVFLAGCGSSGSDQETASESAPQSTDYTDATKLCDAMIQSGASSCEPKAFSLSIDATIRTDAGNARQICEGISSQIAQYAHFENLKTLNIYYPNTTNPMASCRLP